jgi:transcription elongation GreA/GreB family factor
MSRAFVKETDEIARLGERPVSQHPNYVTPEGRAQIEGEVKRLSQDFAAAEARGDRERVESIGRDLRYWMQRLATAQTIVGPPDKAEVRFGSTVTIVRRDGRRQTWRIVGEDEADPASGTISYVSPLARALAGKKLGDCVSVGDADVEIVAIVR